jgi:hypothetical protein
MTQNNVWLKIIGGVSITIKEKMEYNIKNIFTIFGLNSLGNKEDKKSIEFSIKHSFKYL